MTKGGTLSRSYSLAIISIRLSAPPVRAQRIAICHAGWMVARYEAKTVEHLGLVAGMFDELGIGELIDQFIPQDKDRRFVTIGQAVKAMVINGLGFINRRLYLTPRFFKNKPTDQLIGPEIKAEHLNDDALGKALDRLHQFGVTELFTIIAQQAATRLELNPKIAHLDSSSFHLDGGYNSGDYEPVDGVIQIKRGYSRDNRPDLNQVVLELIAENTAGLPLLMRPLSGNASDKTSFQETVLRHAGQLQNAGVEVLVTDSAGYNQDTLKTLNQTDVTWVMGVPATLTQAKKLLDGSVVSDFSTLAKGMECSRVDTVYAGVKQRWLVIRSDPKSPSLAARERARGSAIGSRGRSRRAPRVSKSSWSAPPGSSWLPTTPAASGFQMLTRRVRSRCYRLIRVGGAGLQALEGPDVPGLNTVLEESREDHGVIVRDDALSAGLRRYLSTGSVRSWLRMGRWCRVSKANLRSGRRPSGCLSYSWMCTCFSSLPTRFRLWR